MQRQEPGCSWAGVAALYKWHKRCTSSSSWESVSWGVLGRGVLDCGVRVCVGSLAGAAGLGQPQQPQPLSYTSVEKYSVFRFSSAKEMGGCCR